MLKIRTCVTCGFNGISERKCAKCVEDEETMRPPKKQHIKFIDDDGDEDFFPTTKRRRSHKKGEGKKNKVPIFSTTTITTCSFRKTGKTLCVQFWAQCLDCHSRDEGGCIACITMCHANHRIGPIQHSDFYCDCGHKGCNGGDSVKQKLFAAEEYVLSQTFCDIVLKPQSEKSLSEKEYLRKELAHLQETHLAMSK